MQNPDDLQLLAGQPRRVANGPPPAPAGVPAPPPPQPVALLAAPETTPVDGSAQVPGQALVVQEPPIRPSDMVLSGATGGLKQLQAQLGVMLQSQVQPSLLAARINALWEDRRNRRRPLEEEWMECIRRYNGQYSGEEAARLAANPNRSKAWVGLTRMKCDALHGDVMDVLRGAGSDRTWDLQPRKLAANTPIPPDRFPPGATYEIINEERELRADGMKMEIQGQMDDGDLPEQLSLAAYEGVILGTMGIKGPFTIKDEKPKWEERYDANMKAIAEVDYGIGFMPVCRYVSILNLYPDMESTDFDPNRSMIEVMTLDRRGMLDLATQEGVNPAAVLRCLQQYPSGNYTPEPHTQEIRAVVGDAEVSRSARWRILNYWGELTGQELKDCGIDDVPDEALQVSVKADIMVCGEFRLRIKKAPPGNLYKLAPIFRRGTPGFGPFGQGMPIRMKTSQDICNSGMRHTLNNMAISTGPMFEVNTSLFWEAPENADDIYGWKVWLTKHDGHSGKKAIQVFEIPVNTQQFMIVVDFARRMADEESSRPALTGGMTGAGTTKTVGGMSILNTNAGKQLNEILCNIDDYVMEPIVEGYYDWNMRYSIKDWIFVGCKVVATGAKALMSREVQSQRLIQAAQVFAQNPKANLDFFMRQLARTLGFNPSDAFISDEEFAAQQAQQAEALGGQVGPAMDKETPSGPGAPPPHPGMQMGMTNPPRRGTMR